MILISACLCGINCCYDGGNAACMLAKSLLKKQAVMPVCPEQLGGLPTPRPPAEIVGGDGEDVLRGKAKVKNSAGEDVTREYVCGAREVYRIAKLTGAKKIMVKRRSPACGFGQIYKSGRLSRGNGVCAALLLRHGIEIVCEKADKKAS